MRILVIYPKPDVALFYSQAPMGVLYIGAALEKKHEVRIYDANVDDQSLESVIAEFDPHIIGVSFTTGCVQTSFAIAQKYGGNGRLMLAGGFHPTYQPQACIDAGFDIVARGEVEDTISDFLENYISSFYPSGLAPRGYFFKDASGNPIDTGIAKAADVNRLSPGRHLTPAKYNAVYTHGLLMGSRGCRYSCVFCAAGRTGYRQRHIKNVIKEIEYIVYREKHKEFHFADDIFTDDPKWVNRICREIIDRKIQCEWSANSRCDIPPKNWGMFDQMHRAGCKFLLLGVESGSQKSLKNSGKGLHVNKVLPMIQRVRDSGMQVRCNLMVALPGSTYEDNLKTIDLVEQIQPDQITMSLCMPYPGTVLYEKAHDYGIRFKNPKWTSILQRDYISVGVEEFSQVMEYSYISAKEIYSVVEKLRDRLRPYGYAAVNEGSKKRGCKIIKTFLDKPKLLPIKNKNNADKATVRSHLCSENKGMTHVRRAYANAAVSA